MSHLIHYDDVELDATEWRVTTFIRNKNSYQRCLPQVSVLRYENKIEFKSFFAFVVLVFMAWFNRLGLLNLGQFWPLFVVEWRIFITHET